jgi:hypothetical protein
MQNNTLDGAVCADHDQLLQSMAGRLIPLILVVQPGYLASYNDVVHQRSKWHYYNDCLPL